MILKRSNSEILKNDELIDNFDAIAHQINSKGKPQLSDQDILDFMNFLGLLNIDSSFTLVQLRRIEGIVRGLPRDFLLLDQRGEKIQNNDLILSQISAAKVSITKLKLSHLLDKH